MSGIMSAEEMLKFNVQNQSKVKTFKIGTVTDKFANGTAKIKFDGEDTASEKQYSYLARYAPTVGDRVLLAVVSGTYIILDKINYNVSPS